MKLGSLFDGSGGFPLAGVICGVEPVWASEIEPYPIKVTSARFPNMKHLGDVKSINGAEIEPVDIVTFGSPCQDLSTAGKRAGLIEGERSSLFFEAIRIIREMRNATNGEYPKFAILENVPGMLTSNDGEDFRTVLQTFCEVKDRDAHVPRPRKWLYAGTIMGDSYSIAWRILDACKWGVPQRRRRVFLVADLRGGGAPEVLFKRTGLPGNLKSCGAAWERASSAPEDGTGKAVCYSICSYASNSMKSNNPYSGCYEATQSRTIDITGGNPSCNQGGLIIVDDQGGVGIHVGDKAVSPCLRANSHGKQPYICTVATYAPETDICANYKESDTSRTLLTKYHFGSGGDAALCVTKTFAMQGFGDYIESDNSSALKMRDYKDATDLMVDSENLLVRRLTPTECGRLQGFPDGWAVEGSDAAQYKMWGNGVALPCVVFVMSGIVEELKNDSIG